MLSWALLKSALAGSLLPFAARFLLCWLLGLCLRRGFFLFGFSFRIFVFFLVLERLKLEALRCLGMNSAGGCLQSRYGTNSSGAALALAQAVLSREWPPRSCFALALPALLQGGHWNCSISSCLPGRDQMPSCLFVFPKHLPLSGAIS